MGSRPSQFKKSGGGFLKGVDGVITGYEFTDEFNGKPYDPTPVKGKVPFHSLNCLLSVRVDGAEEDTTTTLFVGGYDDFVIIDDGHTLYDSAYDSEEEAIAAGKDARELGQNTAFTKLISSLCHAGFPETNLPEDRTNFESIIGTRVRFEQQTDVEGTQKLGKRKDKKTGKEYDRQDLVIDQVYSLPGTTTAAPAAKAAKPVVAAKAKGPKAAAAPAGTDVAALATETITTIVAEAPDNSISKAKLGMKLIAKLMKHPEREAIRKWANEDANLSAIDGLAFDGTTVSIAA